MISNTVTNRIKIARRIVAEGGTVPDNLLAELAKCAEDPKSFLDGFMIDGSGYEGMLLMYVFYFSFLINSSFKPGFIASL